jgi:hypothetical protein
MVRKVKKPREKQRVIAKILRVSFIWPPVKFLLSK